MKYTAQGVHASHCCARCGCSYSYGRECPVETGAVKQEYPCEACGQEPKIDPLYLEYLQAKYFHDAALADLTGARVKETGTRAYKDKLFTRWQAAGGKKVMQ